MSLLKLNYLSFSGSYGTRLRLDRPRYEVLRDSVGQAKLLDLTITTHRISRRSEWSLSLYLSLIFFFFFLSTKQIVCLLSL
jgi:hypothetical protein